MAQKLAETVYRALREDIMCNRLQPGAALDEKAIAERFQTSRTPVREAILALEKEALLKIYPRNGTYVSDIDVLRVGKAVQVKARLEGLAAELAFPNITEKDLATLQELLEIPVGLSGEELSKEFVRRDTTFHTLIRTKSNNDVLRESIERIEYDTLRYWYYAFPTHPWFIGAVENLEHVVAAYQDHDIRRAREEMEKHVMVFYSLIKELQ